MILFLLGQRVDDLVDVDETGSAEEIALRETLVLLDFQVDSQGRIFLGEENIPLGASEIKVQAKYLVNGRYEEQLSGEELENLFDIGIVGLKIAATSKQQHVNGELLTRITIEEVITELNGIEVTQSKAMQQVFDVRPDFEHGFPPPHHLIIFLIGAAFLITALVALLRFANSKSQPFMLKNNPSIDYKPINNHQ
jgi:hypothetical protein